MASDAMIVELDPRERLVHADDAREAPPQAVSFRANISWTLIGNIGYAGCQWAILASLAKLGQASMVGEFALALALTAPPTLFASSLRGLQATDARREFSFYDYLSIRAIILAIAVGIIAMLLVRGQYDRSSIETVALVGIAKLFDALSDNVYGMLQQHERMDRIAKSRLLQGFFQASATIAILWAYHSILLAMVSLAVISACVTLTYDLPSAALYRPLGRVQHPASSTSARRRWKLAVLMLPLGCVTMFVSLNASLPRYYIDRFHNAHDLGIFAAISYVFVAGGTVVAAIGNVIIPRLARSAASNSSEDFRQLITRALAVSTLGCIAMVLVSVFFGPLLLKVLYTPEYANHSLLLLTLTVAAAVGYIGSIFGYALTAARAIHSQFVFVLVTTGTIWLLCLLLIPRFGMMGAASAILCGALIQTLGFAVVLLSVIKRLRRNQVRGEVRPGLPRSAHVVSH